MSHKTIFLWVGIFLSGSSLLILGLSFYPGWLQDSNPAIIFLTLGGIFNFLQYLAQERWEWKGWLFIPNFTFTAFGIVFMLNTVTVDWHAWAYAWLLCLTGVAFGLAFAIRATGKIKFLYQPSLWAALACLSLACIFGAITGGPFIKIFILLVLVGMGLVLFFEWKRSGEPLNLSRYFAEPVGFSGFRPWGHSAEILIEPLSKREVEVLQWVAEGLTNAEIAARLVVATSTVKTHINNIYNKLGVTTRTGALKRAQELGLLQN